MPLVRMNLQPAPVLDWETEIAFASRLGEERAKADDVQARTFFDEVDISLPQDIQQRFLSQYAVSQPTPFSEALLSDITKFDYYLLEVPITIVVPEDRSLVCLGLSLDMQSSPQQDPPVLVLPYSLFPTTGFKEKDWDIGELSLDTAKALSALIPGSGAFANALKFEIKFPLKWKTLHWTIQSSNQLRNPAKWVLKDEAIQNGFNAYTVVRAPIGVTVKVEANLQAVIKKGRLFATAETKQDRLVYTLSRD